MKGIIKTTNIYVWHVVYTKAKTEAKVAQRLIESGIEIYFPEITELKQWSDRKRKITRPLLTSYVFVKVQQKDYETVRRVPGVVNFIYHIGKPAVVRQSEIDSIKLFLLEIDTESIEFEPFEKIVIECGPLKGKSGIIQRVGKKRLRIIISELQTSIIADIEKEDVKKK